ncbi:MAG: hypothetical protein NC123_15870, partial [Butyrivibrio sp.]|nr:hypothetical protein [Butyrivibrio sp.]
VLHYVNCPEAPDISLPQAIDRASIEKIVMEILHSGDNGQKDTINEPDFEKAVRTEQASIKLSEQRRDVGSKLEQKEMDETAWAMIADTMSAFRNS